MNKTNHYFGLMLFCFGFVLLALGCKSEYSVKNFNLTISDTVLFETGEEIFLRNTCFYVDKNGREYYVYASKNQRGLIFCPLIIGDEKSKMTFKLPAQAFGKFGLLDFNIINLDSILVQPDNGPGQSKNLFLVDSNGILDNWQIDFTINEDEPFLFEGTPHNRLTYNAGRIFSQVYYYKNRQWLENGGISSPTAFFSLPHQLILNTKTGEYIETGFFPEKLKSGEFAHGLIHKTFIGNTMVIGYMFQPELQVFSEKDNYLQPTKINLEDLLSFETYGKLTEKTSYQLAVKSDMISRVIWDEYQKLLYVFYTKAIKETSSDGYETFTIQDKPEIVAVFNRNFELLGTAHLPKSWGCNGSSALVTPNGILLGATDMSPHKHKYYLVKITP